MRSCSISARLRLVLCGVVAPMLLSACAQPATPAASVPKPVKTEMVVRTDLHQADSFVGTLRARQRTELGFESSGRVVAILVDVGDRVRAGQLLARLDESPSRWRLDKAQADRRAAAATLAERRTHLRQQEALARDGIISPVALQAAQATYQQATSQLEAAAAAEAAARRDFAMMRITAPFDGEVVARHAQPFVDVTPGQTILQVESGNALEVVAMLPDTVAATLVKGAQAHAVIGNDRLKLTMERLSGRNDNGSLVQAIFRVHQAPAAARSGGAVSVELPRERAQAFTLPVSAVMPGVETGRGSVFVIDGGTLQRRTVHTERRPIPGGRIAITDGLRAGEQVVVAGTAFLSDGQSVVAHESQTVLQGARP